ncbi:MAG: hypothetical protein KDD94_11155, partial [Calditrichaeota bacterium]|nr:hypothetical protein [Calditrichota bacterium]
PITSSASSLINHYFTYANLVGFNLSGLEITVDVQPIEELKIALNFRTESELNSTFSRNSIDDSDEFIRFNTGGRSNLSSYLSFLLNYQTIDYIGSGFEQIPVTDLNFDVLMNYQTGYRYTKRVTINSFKEIDTRFAEIGSKVNGEEGPSIFTVDLRIAKHIPLLDDYAGIYAFIEIENLLNTETVLRVYPATGEPDEDGYLATNASMNDNVTDTMYKRQAYRYLLNNPANWGKPRAIRLGLNIQL